MEVRIVDFPETKVAVAEHHGPPELEYETVKKLVAWRLQNGLTPDKHQTYGVHYNDPYSVAPSDYRVDLCVSYDDIVLPNPQGIISKVIPASRCALATHLGSREHNAAAVFLGRDWLPSSGESLGSFPIFFHYVNVGPQVQVQEHDMVTDVYLPLR